MKYIDILTTQKVAVSYEISSFWMRAISFFIDQFILVLFLTFSSMILGFLNMLMDLGTILAWINIPVFLFYSLVFEHLFNGQTLGKKILGIRVVKLNGEKLSLTDCLIRWSVRLIDIWLTIGAVATIVMHSKYKGQRLGDILANTAVINIRSSTFFSLNDILSIKSIESYNPKYFGVKSFKEREMIFVKEVLDRHKKYSNSSTLEVVTSLSNIIAAKLDIQCPSNRVDFLNTVLKDYIVLTR